MKLQDILKNVKYTILKGTLGHTITDITYDSRKSKPNTIYVALKGYNTDGHDYINDAIKNGASVIITSKVIDLQEDVTVLKVDDTRTTLAYISSNFFNNPEEKIFTIGVTGTTGKTTTTHMIWQMLESAGIKCGLIGSIGIKYNDRIIHTNNTTPESYEVLKYFREMLDAGITHVVMEVSSQAYKLNRLAGLLFDIGVLTNLTTDHIGPGEHDSWEEYASCKNKLFLNSKQVVINNDSDYLDYILKGVCTKTTTYGLVKKSDITASGITLINKPDFLGTEFKTSGLLNETFKISIPGLFNIYNALCAITVCRILEVDTAKTKETILNFQVRGRMELALITPKYKVLIDYAHTEDGMNCLVKTLREYEPTRLISVFGGGGNRPKERRYNLGEIIGGSSDLCIITMDNPRFEDLESINNDIKVGLDKVGAKYIEIPDRASAIKYACNNAEDGDLILLVGKGHEEYQDIKGEKVPFSELEIIAEIKKNLELKV